MKTKLNVISAAIIGIIMMSISAMPALAVSPEVKAYALTKGYFYQFLSDAEKAA